MSNVINSTHAEFEAAVLKSKIPVLVDFWAPWCAPCRAMAPILDEISLELADKVKIVKVDIDDAENKALGAKYQIRSIPNMKLFKDGEELEDFVGLRAKEVLVEELKKALKIK